MCLPLEDTSYVDLKKQYLLLVNVQLPLIASQDSSYPVQYNHCFARIALDSIYQCKWDLKIKRPAITNMSKSELRKALKALWTMSISSAQCNILNQQSLNYRKVNESYQP